MCQSAIYTMNSPRLTSLLYRLNDMISRLNKVFVVLISVLTFLFHFYSDNYRKENKDYSRLNDIFDVSMLFRLFLCFLF